MARYKVTDIFESIEATGLNGKPVTLAVRHTDSFVQAFMRGNISKDKKLVREIIDVRGAPDGANSVVKSQWRHLNLEGSHEILRIREKSEELKSAFQEANITMPTPQQSLGLIGRNIRDFCLGHVSRVKER